MSSLNVHHSITSLGNDIHCKILAHVYMHSQCQIMPVVFH